MNDQWTTVCKTSDIAPNTGICALVQKKQIAIFWEATNDHYYAVGNYDPCSDANVISRGMIGSIGESIVVASPIYKQHFDLQTGICLEDPDQKLGSYSVRVVKESIQVKV